MKKLRYFVCAFLCIMIMPCFVMAESVEYTLFETNIKLNKNRTIDVKENYNVYFINDTKTLTRKLNGTINEIRPDKSSLIINSVVSNIKSNSKINVKEKNKVKEVKIDVDGSQDEVNEYSLSYKVDLGKDASRKNDEFYYDLVNDLNSPISSFNFTITLPDNVKPSQVKFLIDGKYNLREDDLTLNYDKNKITGTYNLLLEKNQKLSIRIEYKDGYFTSTSDNFNKLNYLVLILPTFTLILIFFYWFKYGKGNKLNIRKSSAIPYKFDPAEIGYLYKGSCEEMDLVTLIIFLANKGYIKIIENDDGYKLGKENSFKFVKMKEYEGNNAAQKIIFENLFKESDVVELENIEYHFFDKIIEAKSMLENHDNYKKLFFTDINFKKLVSLILIVLSTVLVNVTPINIFINNYILSIFISLILSLGLYIIFVLNIKWLLKIILGFGSVGAISYFEITSLMSRPEQLQIYIIGTILILILSFIYTKLPNRTKYGNKVLGDIYGLKMYLETITEKEIREKMEENPNFYFDMMPYAYVIDSFDIWIRKGDNIITTQPEWCSLQEEFKLKKFAQFIKNILYTTTMVMMKRNYGGVDDYELSQKVKTNLNE